MSFRAANLQRNAERRTLVIHCTRTEKAAFQRAADRSGLSLGAWVKRRLIEAARDNPGTREP